MAVASGAARIDAMVVLGESGAVDDPDQAVLSDFAGGSGVVVHVGDPRGAIRTTLTI